MSNANDPKKLIARLKESSSIFATSPMLGSDEHNKMVGLVQFMARRAAEKDFANMLKEQNTNL